MTTLRPLVNRIFPSVFTVNPPAPGLPYIVVNEGGESVVSAKVERRSPNLGSIEVVEEA